MVSGAFAATKGQRECQDIIKAAVAQGWTTKQSGNNHLYLIPPDPNGTPVGISSTPSDKNFRHQIIRFMKRSGFIWPPNNMNVDIIKTCEGQGWKVEKVPGGGRVCVSKGMTKVMIPVSCDGQSREYILQHLKRGGLTWPWTEEYVVPDSPPVEAVEVTLPNQEEPVVMAVQEKVYTPTGGVKWIDINDSQWEPGWRISSRAELQKPNGEIICGKGGFSKQPNVIVGIKRASGLRTTTRVDKLVLTAFKGEGSYDAVPVHLDDDPINCNLENLEWGEPTLRSVPKKAEDKEQEPQKGSDVLSIEDLELSQSTFNHLARNNIWNTGDISGWSTWSLFQRKMPISAIKEVSDKMTMLGLSMEPTPAWATPLTLDVTPEAEDETTVEPVPEVVESDGQTGAALVAEVVAEIAATTPELVTPADEPEAEELDSGQQDAEQRAHEEVNVPVELKVDPVFVEETVEKFKKPAPRRKTKAKAKAAVPPPVTSRAALLKTDIDKVAMNRSFSLNGVRIEVDENGDFTEIPDTTDLKSLATIFLAIDRWKSVFNKN
jgi:hypothetical protein